MNKQSILVLVVAVIVAITSVTGKSAALPDLYDDGEAYRSFSPKTVCPDRAFEVSCDVRNGGDANSGSFVVRFYASENALISVADYYIGELTVPELAKNDSYSCDWSGSFPISIPAGSYYVGWIMDADEVVDETDEYNNWAYKAGYKLTVVSGACPDLLHVDSDAIGANNGLSWEDAFNHLQDALAAASSGCEIRVAEGIYKPDEDLDDPAGTGDRDATFQFKDGVTIKGGYAGWGEPDPNARDIDAHETVLSGDLDGDDVDVNEPCDLLTEPTRGENSYHVVTGDNVDANAVLDGFTIKAGNSDGVWPRNSGGGMFNRESSPTVTDCNLSGNSALYGGAMSNNYNCSPTVVSCTFGGNYASDYGGAMDSYENGSLTVINCTFSGNFADQGAGGVMSYRSAPKLTNCTFSGNAADQRGGAVMSCYSAANLTNCTFSGNSAGEGGGMYSQESEPNLSNCTFGGNVALDGNGLACNSSWPEDPSNLQVANCIFWDGGDEIWNNDGSTITVTYSCIQDEDASDANIPFDGVGNHNIDDDPDFVCDPNDGGDGWGDDPATSAVDEGANDDFGDMRLSPGSLCIDAGDNTAVPADSHDLNDNGDMSERIPFDRNGDQRFTDDPWTVDTGNPDVPDYPEIVDMGAYEFFGWELAVSSSLGGSVIDPGEGLFQYSEGAVVQIEAESEANCCFVSWTGTAVDEGKVADPNSATTTATVDEDYTLQANFDCNEADLLLAMKIVARPEPTDCEANTVPEHVGSYCVGGTYYLELWVQILEPPSGSNGLNCVFADVIFDDSILSAISVEHCENFATFPSGTVKAGQVDDLGGCNLIGGLGITPEWVLVARVMMAADMEGQANVSLACADAGCSIIGYGLVPCDLVEFEACQVTIESCCIYDGDGDCLIGPGDLSLFACCWLHRAWDSGCDGTVPCVTWDFDCDGTVGPGDLAWFATGWLKGCNDPTIQLPPCRSGAGAFSSLSTLVAMPSAPDVDVRCVTLTSPSASDTTGTLPASLSSLTAGRDYYVEVWAADVGSTNTGLTSVYVDMQLNPCTMATIESISHGGIFTLFESGTIGSCGIDELGGSSLSAAGIEPQWVRVAVVKIHAEASGRVCCSLTPGTTGIAVLGRGLIPRSDARLPSCECLPSSYSTFNDWDALGRPDCWCWPYQCDGDADGATETALKYRIYGKDLGLVVENWRRKINDPLLDPCADIDHKSETFLEYRVYGRDLAKIVENWKKKDTDLAGDCPRVE